MDVADLLEFLTHFGTVLGESGYDAAWDFDNNGNIGVWDLMQVLAQFDPIGGGGLMDKTSGGK